VAQTVALVPDGERFRYAYALARSVYCRLLANLDWTRNSRLAGWINLGGHLVDGTRSVLKGVLRNLHCQAGYHSPLGKIDFQDCSHAFLLRALRNSNCN
jgi:hypothetical protein